MKTETEPTLAQALVSMTEDRDRLLKLGAFLISCIRSGEQLNAEDEAYIERCFSESNPIAGASGTGCVEVKAWKPECDCYKATPSYPTFREKYHIEGCKFYVPDKLAQWKALRKEIGEKFISWDSDKGFQTDKYELEKLWQAGRNYERTKGKG